jgi:hypothetical protein
MKSRTGQRRRRDRGVAPLGLFFAILLTGLVGAGCSAPSSTCEAGASGCACGPGSTCDADLVCDPEARLCGRPRTRSLPRIDDAARSCEVLLEDTGARVVGTRFDASLRGEHVRQAPRTALAFHALADAPIGGGAVQVELVGDGDLHVARAQCFDREGRAIEGGGMATGG